MRPIGRTSWAIVPLAAAALGLAACGGASQSAGGVRDFAEVQTGETQIEVLGGGTAAVIRLVTDPPTVCAVAFGRDDTLGRIANDPGMGGTAIRDHAVVLRGLTPETTYHYRLTATDAGGRVYQTRQPLTFVTEAQGRQEATAAGANIALGAEVVTASSQWSDDFAAPNAIDGDITTEWSSAGDGDRAFITIDLGSRKHVSGVAFRTRTMSDGSAITRSFTVTVDGTRRLGPFPAGDASAANVAGVSFTGRVLRFDVDRSSGGNTGAVEIEVYADRRG